MNQHFPLNQKYLSLFPHNDTEVSKAQRQKIMDKILKVVEVRQKLRDKELEEMDRDDIVDKEKVKKVKQLEEKDAFFTIEEPTQPIEKPIV